MHSLIHPLYQEYFSNSKRKVQNMKEEKALSLIWSNILSTYSKICSEFYKSLKTIYLKLCLGIHLYLANNPNIIIIVYILIRTIVCLLYATINLNTNILISFLEAYDDSMFIAETGALETTSSKGYIENVIFKDGYVFMNQSSESKTSPPRGEQGSKPNGGPNGPSWKKRAIDAVLNGNGSSSDDEDKYPNKRVKPSGTGSEAGADSSSTESESSSSSDAPSSSSEEEPGPRQPCPCCSPGLCGCVMDGQDNETPVDRTHDFQTVTSSQGQAMRNTWRNCCNCHRLFREGDSVSCRRWGCIFCRFPSNGFYCAHVHARNDGNWHFWQDIASSSSDSDID